MHFNWPRSNWMLYQFLVIMGERKIAVGNPKRPCLSFNSSSSPFQPVLIVVAFVTSIEFVAGNIATMFLPMHTQHRVNSIVCSKNSVCKIQKVAQPSGHLEFYRLSTSHNSKPPSNKSSTQREKKLHRSCLQKLKYFTQPANWMVS